MFGVWALPRGRGLEIADPREIWLFAIPIKEEKRLSSPPSQDFLVFEVVKPGAGVSALPLNPFGGVGKALGKIGHAVCMDYILYRGPRLYLFIPTSFRKSCSFFCIVCLYARNVFSLSFSRIFFFLVASTRS